MSRKPPFIACLACMAVAAAAPGMQAVLGLGFWASLAEAAGCLLVVAAILLPCLRAAHAPMTADPRTPSPPQENPQ